MYMYFDRYTPSIYLDGLRIYTVICIYMICIVYLHDILVFIYYYIIYYILILASYVQIYIVLYHA